MPFELFFEVLLPGRLFVWPESMGVREVKIENDKRV